MPSRGVSGRFWGREKNCRGPCGKVWSASEVDASVHRRGWCSARFIFLSSSPLYVVIIVIFLLDCAVQLLWMRLPVGDPLFGLSGDGSSARLGLGRHSTRRLFPFGFFLPVSNFFPPNSNFIFQSSRFCCC